MTVARGHGDLRWRLVFAGPQPPDKVNRARWAALQGMAAFWLGETIAACPYAHRAFGADETEAAAAWCWDWGFSFARGNVSRVTGVRGQESGARSLTRAERATLTPESCDLRPGRGRSVLGLRREWDPVEIALVKLAEGGVAPLTNGELAAILGRSEPAVRVKRLRLRRDG